MAPSRDRPMNPLVLSRRDFLWGALAAAGGSVSCAHPRAPTEVPPWAAAAGFSSRIRLLTWNVFMMPSWIGESPANLPRAAAIATTLLREDFDVLCLQKVFDGAARSVLEGALAARYPYRYGPANDGCSLKLNSGVWILSREPLFGYEEIQYNKCRNVECFSRKGAIFLTGRAGGIPFHLVTTHLQGEEEPRFTLESQHVRDHQTVEIRDRLVLPHLAPALPFLFCGDFGTPRYTENGRHETLYYHRLLQTLGADNGRERRITLDDSLADNDVATDDTGRKNEMDYVLVRANGHEVRVERKVRVFRRPGWDETRPTRCDLSYRYAVEATLTFGRGERLQVAER